jgi:hypothetical protein
MPSRKHLPKPDRRRALELLASCRDGCTEAMMLAHGFTIPQMVELLRLNRDLAGFLQCREGEVRRSHAHGLSRRGRDFQSRT